VSPVASKHLILGLEGWGLAQRRKDRMARDAPRGRMEGGSPTSTGGEDSRTCAGWRGARVASPSISGVKNCTRRRDSPQSSTTSVSARGADDLPAGWREPRGRSELLPRHRTHHEGHKGHEESRWRPFLASWLPGFPRSPRDKACDLGSRGNPGSQEERQASPSPAPGVFSSRQG